NNKLYFKADNGTRGSTIWVLVPGTGPATSLHTLTAPPPPGQVSPFLVPFQGFSLDLLAVGNTVYFAADDGLHGRELWKTDGTVGGTQMVKDIRPGLAGAQISFLAAVNGKALFVAND